MGSFKNILWHLGLVRKNICPYCNTEMFSKYSHSYFGGADSWECRSKSCELRLAKEKSSTSKKIIPILILTILCIVALAIMVNAADVRNDTPVVNDTDVKEHVPIRAPNKAIVKRVVDENVNQSKKYSVIHLDSYYNLYDMDDVIQELKLIDYPEYKKNYFDCEDFTRYAIVELQKKFEGLLIGEITVSNETNNHRALILFDVDYNIYYYSPEDNKYFEISQLQNMTNYEYVKRVIV